MSENLKRRLAVLEAFAQSKPIEFDGFVLRWEKENVEKQVAVEVVPEAPVSQEQPEADVKTEEKPVEEATQTPVETEVAEIAPVKKTRKKATVVEAPELEVLEDV